MTDERVISPSEWRQRHGAVERLEASIKDVNGMISRPFRGIYTLTMMEAKGTISPSMREAGERFHDAFRRAGFDGLVAADPRRIPVLSSNNKRLWGSGNKNERGYWEVHSAISGLGGLWSITGSCAWHVLGLEETLKQWCQHYQWSGGSVLERAMAAGILISALDRLERHWGFKTVR